MDQKLTASRCALIADEDVRAPSLRRDLNFIPCVNPRGRAAAYVHQVRKTFLLQSSPNSRTIATPALISPNENRNTPEDVLFKKNGVPVAVLLEGRFSSLYKNRIGQAQRVSSSIAEAGELRGRLLRVYRPARKD